MNAKVIAICSQKGGTGKTTTCANLGFGLARQGKKVLLIDSDPQGDLTASLGYRNPGEIKETLANIMAMVIRDKDIPAQYGLLHHPEGVDLIPCNGLLSELETTLVNAIDRERTLHWYVETVRESYEYILIDCTPSLGMLATNALCASDSVIIPSQPQYLPVKDLEGLLKTVFHLQRRVNRGLTIGGIVLTMVDERSNFTREVMEMLHKAYDGRITVFSAKIPMSVRAAEASAEGASIYAHDRRGKVAAAYAALTKEVMSLEKQRA